MCRSMLIGLAMVLGLAAAWAWAGDVGTSPTPGVSADPGPSTQPAGTASVPANAAEIARLIEQLGGETFTQRDAAQEALVRIGPTALPALRAGSQDKNPERNLRAKRAILSIERSEEIPDRVLQVLLKTYMLGRRTLSASPPGLTAKEFLEEIATDDQIAELLDIARNGSLAERARLKPAVIAALGKYVDELPESTGLGEPWRPSAYHAPGVFVSAYLLSTYDDQPQARLDLLVQVLLRHQNALAAYLNGNLKDFTSSQGGLLLAFACCRCLDLCQRDQASKGVLNAGQEKALKDYEAVKASAAGRGLPAEGEQVAVFRAAVEFALAGGNQKVRKLHDRWLALTQPARQQAVDQARRIRDLIEQLGADDAKAAKAAQDELRKMGAKALDALFAAAGNKDARLSARASAVIRLILPFGKTAEGIQCAVRPARECFMPGEDILLDVYYLNVSDRPITVCARQDPFWQWMQYEIKNDKDVPLVRAGVMDGLRPGCTDSDFVTLAPGRYGSFRQVISRENFGRQPAAPGRYFIAVDLNRINRQDKVDREVAKYCIEEGIDLWQAEASSGPAELTIVPMPEIYWAGPIGGPLAFGIADIEPDGSNVTVLAFCKNVGNDKDTKYFDGAQFEIELDGKTYVQHDWPAWNARQFYIPMGQTIGPFRLDLADYVAAADRQAAGRAPRPLAGLTVGKTHRLRAIYVGLNGKPRIVSAELPFTIQLPGPQIAGWGPADKGAQARLKAKKTTWKSGEAPEFILDVINQGKLNLKFRQPSLLDSVSMEVDGRWYHYSLFVTFAVPLLDLGPGAHHEGLGFVPSGSTSKDKSMWRTMDSPGRKLVFLPGKHTIRVRIHAFEPSPVPGDNPDQAGESAILTTNAVEIEILPAEGQAPAASSATQPAPVSPATAPSGVGHAQPKSDGKWHGDKLKAELARLAGKQGTSIVNPRGKTVENLRVVKMAIEDYRRAKGALPDSLAALELPAKFLRDGSGRDFVWSGRVATYGYAPGKGATILVGMSSPVSRLLGNDEWWYAVIRTSNDEILISCGTELREVAPFEPAGAFLRQDQVGNIVILLAPADAPAWELKSGIDDVIVRRIAGDKLNIRVIGLKMPGERVFSVHTIAEVKPGLKVLLGSAGKEKVFIERAAARAASGPATQPAGPG